MPIGLHRRGLPPDLPENEYAPLPPGCISKNWQGWEKPEAFKDKADKNSMNSTQQTLVRTWLPRN